MRHATYYLHLILPLIIGGCASSIDFKDPIAVSTAIKTVHSKQDELTAYTGPIFKQDYNKLSLSARKYDRFEIAFYIISVDAIYFGAARNYDTANDLTGNKFGFRSNFKKKNYCDNSGCWQNENFELSTTREYLEANKERDLSIRVSGKPGAYQTFTIPATYIKAFLSIVK